MALVSTRTSLRPAVMKSHSGKKKKKKMMTPPSSRTPCHCLNSGLLQIWASRPLEELGPIKRTPEYNRLLHQAGSRAERSAAAKRPRDGCGSGSNATSSALSKKAILQYFYVPIMQAAKELNVDMRLTLLKKHRWEQGIRRWPHRKLTSPRTLMTNVQEMGGASERCAGKTREVIQILEQERRLLKEAPDVQLEDKTKRLRQACFKANYKKRKLLGASENGAYSEASSSNPSSYAGHRLGCGGRWV